MDRLIERSLIIILLLTPVIRIINGYQGLVGAAFQSIFLILFLLLFFTRKYLLIFHTINGILLALMLAKINVDGFESDYIKLYMLFVVIVLSRDESFLTHAKVFLMNHRKMLIGYVVLINGYLIYALGLEGSYDLMYGVEYFKGSMYHPHTMAYACLFIVLMVIILTTLYKNKWLLLLSIVPIYCINLTGVRSVVIALILSSIFYFITKRRGIGSVIGITLLLGQGWLMATTFFRENAIVEKFLLTNEDVSSGRLTFWQIDLAEFVKYNPIEKMFGKGLDYVEFVNFKYYGMNIGAHNDFITLLLSLGLIGLAVLIVLFFIYCTQVRLEFALMIILLASVNGLFSYSELVFILPLLGLIKREEKTVKLRFKENCYS